MKKYAAILLLMLVLISNIAFSEDVTSTDVTVLIDGKKLDSIDALQGVNLPPIIYNNRTMIPLRKTIEAFGIPSSQISWDSEERSVTIITNDFDTIWMQINNTSINVNGKTLVNDVPAIIYNNRTYIPTAMISSLLGTIPEWDGINRIVTMTPSTYTLSRFNASFNYPRKHGYILKEDFTDDKAYYFQKNNIESYETESMIIITMINESVNSAVDNYIDAHLLGSDDFSISSTVPIAYSYIQGNSRITFVKHGDETLQFVSNGISYDNILVLIDSINEVK